jgi:metallophosphoesterase (TIGR00282 family)
MRILLIGDIVGRPGREAVQEVLPQLRRRHAIDLVIANVENAAAGFGLTASVGKEILEAGVDVMTGGNHLWDKKGSESYLAQESRLVRPANYPEGAPGRTFVIAEAGDVRVAVLCLQGRVFMPPNDCPFRRLDDLLEEVGEEADVIAVDFHAEATSEKQAFGRYADGRVAVVVGTHTHVPTADESILPGGTAYVTDLGMTGPYDSIIGMEREVVVRKFLSGMPARFSVARHDVRLSGLLVDVDERTGWAERVERVHERMSEVEVR